MCPILVTVFIFVLGCVYAEPNPYIEALNARPWKSIQRYVEVRPGAYLFYWLYYADGTAVDAASKPLVIWIQGGPGFAATGLANFAELGPLDMDFIPRNHTWVNRRNVLLIDHPVGTGFSYAADKSLYVKTDREMALDLHRAVKAFFRRHKQFRKTPTYVVGQSYGGKLVPRLGCYLHKAIESKRLKMNFKGIGIGGGWVDPKESLLVQPQYLYAMGILDQKLYSESMDIARTIGNYIDNKEYVIAQKTEITLFSAYYKCNFDINYDHINKPRSNQALEELSIKVNKYVKPAISHIVDQSLQWRYVSDEVYDKLTATLLAPSMKYLELLLNTTKLKVAVYNGNMDITTPLAGASNWVHKLKWHGAQAFQYALKRPIRGVTNGFYKMEGQLSFWAVFKAGHWVPEDNPEAMEQILEHLISDDVYSYSTK